MVGGRYKRVLTLTALSVGGVLTACSASTGPAAATPTPVSAAPANPVAARSPGASATPTSVAHANGYVFVPVAGSPPQTGHPWMLAVGDSITSGFTKDPARAGVNSSWALQLQGLLAESGRSYQLYDTACPGETTMSYYSQCRGHEAVPTLPDQSQSATALSAIAAHRADLKLIVVDIGSNDLLGARSSGDPVVTGLNVMGRVRGIVAALANAAPGVPIIVGNYYDPFENAGGMELPLLKQINVELAGIATQNNGRIADFFSAINTAAPPDARLCQLVDCTRSDIHPTVAGHTALAHAAFAVIP